MVVSAVGRVVIGFTILVLALLVPSLSRYLFLIGGTPRTGGNIVRYRMRPVIRTLFVGAFLVDLAVVRAGVRNIMTGEYFLEVLFLVLGLACLAFWPLGACEILLDDVGLRLRSMVWRESKIVWSDIDHVERPYNYRASTNTFYIRGKSGVVIVAGDTSFDTTDLIQRIRQRVPMYERPYKRRHWYVG